MTPHTTDKKMAALSFKLTQDFSNLIIDFLENNAADLEDMSTIDIFTTVALPCCASIASTAFSLEMTDSEVEVILPKLIASIKSYKKQVLNTL